MRSPLRNQIFFPIAGLLALAVLLFTAISAWYAVDVRSKQTAKHMEAVTNALGSASYPLTNDVVNRLGAMIGGDVIVVDDRHNITASTLGSPEILQSLLDDLPSATKDASSPQVVRINTNSFWVTTIRQSPVRRPTTLYVMLPHEEFAVVWRSSVGVPLIVATVILILALLLARLISSRIAGRVDKLREQFGRLAQGDFQVVAASGRSDEIRDLMESANVLAEQLRSMQQELLTAQRLQLLGQLSGGLAHQLKNSVAGARMAIQLHQRRCNADDPMIQTALAQLSLTEEQVLAVVSLKADAHDASVGEVCDISQMMRDVVALLQPHCIHWKSQITVKTPDRLPATLHSPQSLKGGLLNLTQNAIEAAGVNGMIDCLVTADDQWVSIDIRDSGPGFATDHSDLVGAFRTTKPEGIGLGLTIAQHAVDQEGGSLTIERQNEHTSVVIRIPWRQLKTTTAAAATPNNAGEGSHKGEQSLSQKAANP